MAEDTSGMAQLGFLLVKSKDLQAQQVHKESKVQLEILAQQALKAQLAIQAQQAHRGQQVTLVQRAHRAQLVSLVLRVHKAHKDLRV